MHGRTGKDEFRVDAVGIPQNIFADFVSLVCEASHLLSNKGMIKQDQALAGTDALQCQPAAGTGWNWAHCSADEKSQRCPIFAPKSLQNHSKITPKSF